jgi:dipeptidyl aminopeptidase/acylaminoacyl peptidase
MKKFNRFILFLALCGLGEVISTQAQNALNYQTPPKAIADLVNAPITPQASFSRSGEFMLLLERAGNPSIEELAQPELRIAGIRINPATNGPSRGGYVENVKLKNTRTGKEQDIKGLPANPKLGNLSLSKDEKFAAMTNTTNTGISLWIVDLTTLEAKKLTDEIVNGAYGSAITWTPDNKILLKAVNPNRGSMPKSPLAPAGPIIQETSGNAAPSRTYQDLLTNSYDEALFAYFMDSQLMLVDLSGSKQAVGAAGLISSVDLSPDGNYILVDVIKKPFSYLVPASRFPYDVEIWDNKGNKVKTLAQIPLDEVRPTGFDATVTGPRSISWRADKGASLYWTEAQDGGDPKVKMEEREIIYSLEAPFTASPTKLASIGYRFGGISWSDDNFALLNERWFASRQERVSVINPSKPGEKGAVIIERNSDDIYNDPGNPVFTTNAFGRKCDPEKRRRCIYDLRRGKS